MSDGSLFDLSAYGGDEPEQKPDEEQIETTGKAAAELSPTLSTPSLENDSVVAPTSTISATPNRKEAAATPTALYRKYRPQTFAANEHFGQEHVVNTLRNAIALDRIAHAYLFCGPRGTGKTSTARILAKAVNCEHPDPNQRPCNECPSCLAIITGATTDVIEIDAASNRGIDDIRDLRERVKYAPAQLKTKFYIIDEAHQITGAAANAFLKTLEEPPAHTKFILATTDPEDLLQTIVSRCQRFDFRRISVDATVANLTRIAEAEKIDIDDDAKAMIARHATGSLRDAQGLLDQVAVYRENAEDESTRVTLELVRTVLGVSRNDRVEEIAKALADRDAGAGVRAIGEAVAAGDDVRQLARQLLTYMRELLLERSGGTSDLDDSGKQLAARFDLAELAELTRLFGEIDFKVKHASISQLPLEIAVIEGAIRGAKPSIQTQQAPNQSVQSQPDQQAPPLKPAGAGNLIGRVQGVGRRTTSTNQQPRSQPAPPAAAPKQEQAAPSRATPSAESQGNNQGTNSGIDVIRGKWGQIRGDVHAINVRIGAVLSEMDPAGLEADKVILTVPYTFHAQKMNSDEYREVVEQVISRVMGSPYTVECFTTDDYRSRPTRRVPSPAQPAATAESVEAQHQDSPTLDISQEPEEPPVDPSESLRAVRNIFDAEEVDAPDS